MRGGRDRLTVDDRGSVVLRGQSSVVRLFSLTGQSGLTEPGARRPTPENAARRAGDRAGPGPARPEAGPPLGTRGASSSITGDAGMGKSRLVADLESEARGLGLRLDLDRERLVRSRRAVPLRAGSSPRPSPTSTGSTRAATPASCCSRRAPTRRRCVATAARSRRSPGTRRSRAGRRRPSTSPTTRPRPRRSCARSRPRTSSACSTRTVRGSSSSTTSTGSIHRAPGWSSCSSTTAAVRPLVDPCHDASGHHPELGGARVTSSGSTWTAWRQPRPRSSRRSSPSRPRRGRRPADPRADPGQPAVHRRDRPSLDRGRDASSCATGGWCSSNRAPPRLPLTLRAVLGARLDGLDEPARDVLSVASVVGIGFGLAELEDLLGRADRTRDARPARRRRAHRPVRSERDVAVQPPARPRGRVCRDAGIAPAAPPRPAGRPARGRSHAGPDRDARRPPRGGRGCGRRPSRSSSRPPTAALAVGAPNEAAGLLAERRRAGHRSPDDIARVPRRRGASALEAARG